MSNALGTWAWVEKTGGKLRARDRVKLLSQGVRALAAARLRGPVPKKIRYIEVEDVTPPDSAICKAAEEICAAASPLFLFNHCVRAYFWARLLNDGKKFDDEALYTALLLHDLGLTDRYRLQAGEGECFTLPAARIAHDLALSHGWSDKRAQLVADAICLHLNVIVADKHGPEAKLVRQGSGADVAGLGLECLHKDQREEVVHRYPRHNQKQEFAHALELEVDQRPGCRIAYLYNNLGFGKMIQQTPMFKE